jgi:hypothetical protein
VLAPLLVPPLLVPPLLVPLLLVPPVAFEPPLAALPVDVVLPVAGCDPVDTGALPPLVGESPKAIAVPLELSSPQPSDRRNTQLILMVALKTASLSVRGLRA